jgi:predicted PurR-regulated permease PerM
MYTDVNHDEDDGRHRVLNAIEGAGVLLLLSVFFAYLLAPVIAALRRRVRTGPRRRPLSGPVAIACVYAVLFVPGALAWRAGAGPVTHWVHVTAPGAVNDLFGGGAPASIDRALARLPIPSGALAVLRRGIRGAIAYVERETRNTLDELIAAAPYAPWLTVAPVFAFLLLTGAPGFQRSALRVMPRGHLRWRAGEYLHDVNSALAGYVRAQASAGVIVGVMCVCGFVLLGAPSAVSMGVAAGILELVPAIGPLTALLMAAATAGDRVLPVVAFLGVLRLVQDYAIYPRLIRHGMHLPTPFVILTVWCGAALAGAAGVILAVPVAGCLSVSIRHWRQYRLIERLVKASAPP